MSSSNKMIVLLLQISLMFLSNQPSCYSFSNIHFHHVKQQTISKSALIRSWKSTNLLMTSNKYTSSIPSKTSTVSSVIRKTYNRLERTTDLSDSRRRISIENVSIPSWAMFPKNSKNNMDESTSLQSLRSIELLSGRVAIVTALYIVTQELTTSEGFFTKLATDTIDVMVSLSSSN